LPITPPPIKAGGGKGGGQKDAMEFGNGGGQKDSMEFDPEACVDSVAGDLPTSILNTPGSGREPRHTDSPPSSLLPGSRYFAPPPSTFSYDAFARPRSGTGSGIGSMREGGVAPI
jgi:hypothetical protein